MIGDNSNLAISETIRELRQELARVTAERDKLTVGLDSVLRDVGNLLARIHRDGGHYQAEHGYDKAMADAEVVVVGYLSAVDQRDAAVEALDLSAEYAFGETIGEMRANISTDLLNKGDARLMWVNEGQFLMQQFHRRAAKIVGGW